MQMVPEWGVPRNWMPGRREPRTRHDSKEWRHAGMEPRWRVRIARHRHPWHEARRPRKEARWM